MHRGRTDNEDAAQGAAPGSAHLADNPLHRLSRAQLDVLHKVAQAYTTAEIARLRGCSTSAVEKLLTTVYGALSLSAEGPVNQRAEAMRVYIAHAGMPARP
jgi:DNA-binding CsgD family transcriptional regulator